MARIIPFLRQPNTARDYRRLMDEPSDPPRAAWEIYEDRKRELREFGLDPDDYQAAAVNLAEELGL